MYLSGSKTKDIPKKYSKNFLDYFPNSKNGMKESASTLKIFQAIAVHSKPPIKKLVFVIKSPVY